MAASTSITTRQQFIMDFIRQHGAVQVEPLADALNVTPQTIRRDLNLLYEMDLLDRVHGGAVIKDGVENLGYSARKMLMVEAKTAIARRAAELIPNHSSLFINIGTTTERVSEFLLEHKGLLVITNNINVATTLWPCRSLEVLIAGGTIRHADGGIVGPSTEEFVDRFKVDYAVIGCSAIDTDGEIFDYDLREVRVAQAIIRRARSVILVTDSLKFQRRAPITIAGLDQIDYLVTDSGLPPGIETLCADQNVRLEVVDVADPRAARTT